MKNLCLLIVLTSMSIIFFSCSKQDSFEEEMLEINTKSLTTPNLETQGLDSIVEGFKMSRAWPADLLQNWDLLHYAPGTMMLKRKNEAPVSTYIVLANLKQGAKVGMVFDSPNSQGAFTRKNLSTWNTYGNFFAIANSSYFNISQQPSQLPFPLKQDGIMYTYGIGGSSADRSREKVVLNVHDQAKYAEILSIGTNPMNYTPMSGCNKSYAGFPGNVGNSSSSSVGRTLVGIKDQDGDGYCEFVILFVSSSKTQSQAYNIMMQEILCDYVMTFDGGGSSQFMYPGYQSSPLISGDNRKLPVSIVIKNG